MSIIGVYPMDSITLFDNALCMQCTRGRILRFVRFYEKESANSSAIACNFGHFVHFKANREMVPWCLPRILQTHELVQKGHHRFLWQRGTDLRPFHKPKQYLTGITTPTDKVLSCFF